MARGCGGTRPCQGSAREPHGREAGPTIGDPTALCANSLGKLWVSGRGADRIERYAPDGTHLETDRLPGSIGVQHIGVR